MKRLVRLAWLSLLVLHLSLHLLPHSPANALVGGDTIDLALQRHIVVVRSTKSVCTGVVMAQDIVLTAAHCAASADAIQVGGNRGWGDMTAPPVGLSSVTKIVHHPQYDPLKDDSPDLAILKLQQPLPYRFVPAFFGASTPANGTNLIAAGYGKSSDADTKGGMILRMVVLRVSYAGRGYIALAGASLQASGANHGDSGGPVFTYRGMHDLVAIIVASSIGRQTMAIAVAPNYGWIKETISALSTP